MAGSRTRSVLLMAHAIESGILGDSEVRALDGLSASGLRARRWLNELPDEVSSRLIATIGDMDQNALDWAMATESDFSSKNGELIPLLGDLRTSVLSQGWHWIDIDPFGSPVAFLDTAIQALARRGVLEVSATDTAALSGSSKNPLMRRYGARVRLDKLKHDSGLRVLMATVARAAARHDRSIEPLLSIWDSHHLRVSVRVRKVMQGANDVEESLGWRIFRLQRMKLRHQFQQDSYPQKIVLSYRFVVFFHFHTPSPDRIRGYRAQCGSVQWVMLRLWHP